jgi:hypothetical protein
MKIVNTQGTDDRQALPGSARKTATLPSAEQSRRQTFPTRSESGTGARRRPMHGWHRQQAKWGQPAEGSPHQQRVDSDLSGRRPKRRGDRQRNTAAHIGGGGQPPPAARKCPSRSGRVDPDPGRADPAVSMRTAHAGNADDQASRDGRGRTGWGKTRGGEESREGRVGGRLRPRRAGSSGAGGGALVAPESPRGERRGDRGGGDWISHFRSRDPPLRSTFLVQPTATDHRDLMCERNRLKKHDLCTRSVATATDFIQSYACTSPGLRCPRSGP